MLVLFHGLTGLLQQSLHKVVLTLHGLQDLRTGQLVPVGGHDGGLGVLLPQHSHGLLDLFLAGRAGAAQQDGGSVGHLVVVELTEVLHIQAHLVHVRHRDKAVQLHVLLVGDGLHGAGHVAELAHAGRLDEDAVGMILLHDLLQGGAEVAHQAAADAAGVHLGDLDAGLFQKAAVNTDLAELVLDQHDLLALEGLGNQLFDERGFACAQESGKNVNFRHGFKTSCDQTPRFARAAGRFCRMDYGLEMVVKQAAQRAHPLGHVPPYYYSKSVNVLPFRILTKDSWVLYRFSVSCEKACRF